MAKVNEKGGYDDEIAAQFKAGIEKFKSTQTW
jgi:F-type H+-transporting ATPase subunit alpha